METNSIEVERMILGSLLIGNTNNIDLIKADFFGNELHKDIFKAIYSLFNKQKPIDMITVNTLMNNDNFIYLSDIAQEGFIGHDIAHINILVNHYKTRETASILMSSVEEIKEVKNIDVFNADISNKLDAIMLSDDNAHNDDMNSITADALIDLKRTFDTEYEQYRTGIPFIDSCMVGTLPKELTIIGARSGVGKTAFALQMFKKQAFSSNPLFITREMDKLQIFYRMLASELRIDGNKFKRRSFTKEEWNRIEKAMPLLKQQMGARINDKVSTITEIKKQLRKTKSNILYVDYIQLLQSENNYGSREREVAAITRELKNITLDFGIPVIALTQLNDNNHDTRPAGERVMRESKAIYHDANNVIYIHEPNEQQIKGLLESPSMARFRREIEEIQDSQFKREKGQYERKLKEIIVDKQRDGMKGSRLFGYTGSLLTFDELKGC